MTCEEFSNEFDVRINTFSKVAPVGVPSSTLVLDEYEKSVYLTSAQRNVAMSLYTGKNPQGDAFEVTEEIRRYLNSLVRTYNVSVEKAGEVPHLKDSTYFVQLPDKLMYIVLEQGKVSSDSSCYAGEWIDIVPIRHDEYHRIKRNPFRGANVRRALRVDCGSVMSENADLPQGSVEIISQQDLVEYYCRYLREPSPIILAPLPDGLSIDGVSDVTECEMPKMVHKIILDNAVRDALMDRTPQQAQQ